jgi:oligopeptidase B
MHHHTIRHIALALVALFAGSQTLAQDSTESTPVSQSAPTAPPQAEKRPHSYSHHGITVEDPYAWLRDQSYPTVDDEDVLAHLRAENAWFEAQMAPHQKLVDELFAEMRARIKEDDSSVPVKDGEYLYWSEFEEGGEYRKHYRRPVAGGEAQLILDENALAEGLEYFNLGSMAVSENGRYLAYSVDDDGAERFDVRIKDLQTGELLPDVIPGILTDLIWAANDTMLVYGPANENWRVDKVLVHRLGTGASADQAIYNEPDEGFRVSPGLSNNREWLLISTGDHETSEIRLVPIADPFAEQVLVRPREKGVEYDVDVRRDTLFVHTNDDHVNFRLATAPLSAPGEWTTLIEGSDEFYLTGFDLFRDYYVTEGRLAGLDQVQLRSYDDPARIEPIDFPEDAYSAGLGNNPEWAQDKLRLGYSSMITPSTVYDYDVATRELETLKVQEIPSGFDPSLYTVERLQIPARDNTMIPVSIVYRKDRPAGQGGPLHLYAYGAYGISIPPGFSTSRFSMVDRGIAYAIAHIRGGDDLGRNWYLSGKLEERTNTFNDFVDVARGLIERGYTSEGRISASGGSAGGELMGAVVNQAPELWGAVVAHVPFVDVLSTMLDSSLPLTPGEWPEWGNPIESKAAFTHILSYSPYDQVVAQDYPPMLVTAGLNDPRVTYWEPAKWVARLRELKTDDNILLLKTNMGAGHGGKSGRFEGLRETAEEVAFILWQLGLAE